MSETSHQCKSGTLTTIKIETVLEIGRSPLLVHMIVRMIVTKSRSESLARRVHEELMTVLMVMLVPQDHMTVPLMRMITEVMTGV